MRSRNARTLNGGVTIATSASAKKVPNRPSESTTEMVQSPTASNGRSAGESGRSVMRAAVDSQRPEREVLRVHVVFQIEDAREARAVPERVLPRAVGLLSPQEVVDAAGDGRSARAAGGEESEQGPGGLAWRRLAGAGERVVVVALAGLSPAAVLVLVALQPTDRAVDVFVTGVLADGGETAQHRPRAVDVVHAPAPVPRTVVALLVTEELDRALGGLEILAVAERAQQLEPAAGQVLGRRIEQGAVIGEGDVVEVETIVVGVEGGPAPVLPLHAEEPAEPALLGRLRGAVVQPADLLERHHDHGGVVEVRVEVVAVLKRPTARLHVRPFHLPVAGHQHLTADPPLGGALQLAMIRRQAALDQRVDRDGGVPH